MDRITEWLRALSIELPAHNQGFLAFFFGTFVLLMVAAFVPRLKAQRPNLILGALVFLVLLVIFATDPPQRWYWTLVFIPPLLVVHHAIFLWLSRPRSRALRKTQSSSAPADASLALAKRLVDSYYSLRTLLIRFAFVENDDDGADATRAPDQPPPRAHDQPPL
jgi:hypothetical protein